MDQGIETKGGSSRRRFLKLAPMAVATGIAVGMVVGLGRPLLSQLGQRRKPPVFPKGSIFTPAKDARKDRV